MKKQTGKYSLGIDIGGTKVLTCLLDSKFIVCASRKIKVEAHDGERVFMKNLVGSIKDLLKDEKLKLTQIASIGIGCPGMIDVARGVVKLSPNISFMKNYPLRTKLKRFFNKPILIENDANAGLYGEYQFGAAVNRVNTVGIFLGTGVGGAMIFNGQLYRGASGMAGEIGHTFMGLPRFLDGSDDHETLESLIGRLKIASDAGNLMLKQKANHLHEMVGYDIKRIKSKSLKKSILLGDVAMQTLMANKAKILGIAMANIVNLLNPEMIVLGGGVIEGVGNTIIPIARQTMKAYALKPNVSSVLVTKAKLGDFAIAKGAAKLAFDTLKH